MTAIAHEITVEESDRRFRAVCACGAYKSTSYSYPGQAESAGAQHVRVKGGIPAPQKKGAWVS